MKKISYFMVLAGLSLSVGCHHRVHVRSTPVGDEVQKPLYFEFGKWALSPEEERRLAEKARSLKSHPTATILLEGHADSIGTSESNLELGDRRARYVKWKLSQEGVPPERVVVTSVGEDGSSTADLKESARQQDRRVDLQVK